MNKPGNVKFIAIFLLLTAAIWLGLSNMPRAHEVRRDAENGYLDLSAFNFADEVCRMYGGWESYPESLYTPRDFEGGAAPEAPPELTPGDYETMQYMTHRLRLAIPSGSIYGIIMRSTDYSMRLFLGGEEKDLVGVPGDSKEGTIPRVLDRTYYFSADSAEVEIIIQVANFNHKDGCHPPVFLLGSERNIVRQVNIDLFLNCFITGCLITSFIYHMGLFLLNRKRSSNLLFAICCLLFSLIVSRIIPWFDPYYNWYIAIRAEYIVLYLTFAVLIKLLETLYPKLFCRYVFITFYAFTAIYLLMVIVFPPVIFTRLLIVHQIASVLLIVYCVIMLLIYALKKRRLQDFLSLAGIFAVSFFGVNDILMRNNISFLGQIAGQFFTSPIGMMFFVYCYALALSIDYAETEQAKELFDRMNRYKTEFLGNISHELKTPLTIISNYAQLARGHAEEAEPRDEYTVSKMLLVSSEAERMAVMVGQLLDIAAIEEGRMRFHLTSVDIAELIRVMISTFYPVLNKNHNTLTADLPPDLGRVTCDMERIRQVLLNLTSNAIRFTRNGTITLSARREGAVVAVSVADTGEGMDGEYISGIFERYTTQGPEPDGAQTGTGLGLYISKSIIDAHGGTIAIRSERGSGTTVTFSLPVSKEVGDEKKNDPHD